MDYAELALLLEAEYEIVKQKVWDHYQRIQFVEILKEKTKMNNFSPFRYV